MAFLLDTGYQSSSGARPYNEDFCGVMLPGPGEKDRGAVAAVADGVSTGGMGKEAAQTTVLSVLRDYFGTPESWHTTVALERIIAAQNAWLSGLNQRRAPALGLTTLTALVLKGHGYTLAHVGDSRAYLLRGGVFTQLTHDHVVNHPDLHHQLLRCVGAQDHIVVDYVQGDLQLGDVFVLLTDGVHGVLKRRQMHALVLGKSEEIHEEASDDASSASIAKRLVDAALQAGSTDNVTALVVRVLGLQKAKLVDEAQASHHLDIPPLLKVGQSVDALKVLSLVADNGVNVLYQVQDANGKRFALKTLHPARAHDPDERAMLVHEAYLMRHLAHVPHLVRLHDVQRSLFYLLQDWHEGQSLEQRLQSNQALSATDVVSLALGVLKALALLHRQGVIHRDIKPSNLHIGIDGVLRILDLGVALSGTEPASMRRLHAGTPSFINPEQWGFSAERGLGSAHPVEELPDAQSDLFALGVTLYQLLTHKLPYGDVLPYQVGRYHRDPTPPTRHNPRIPMWLEHVLLKAVARDKRVRFETAEEFALALERGSARPLTAPKATPVLARDPATVFKLIAGISLLFNFVLVFWLLFLPK